jgi:hypothetical protein
MSQLAGEDILASDIKIPKYVIKAGAEDVVADTTYQADNDFVFTLPVGNYHIELFAHATCTSTGDIKLRWTNTGTMTGLRSRMGPGPATASVTAADCHIQGLSLATDSQAGLTGSTYVIHEDLLVQVTVAGVLTLEWAQFAAAGTTQLTAGSRCHITEIEEF